jgi:hypothetical protein
VASAVQELIDASVWIRGDDSSLSILKADLPKALFEALGLGNVNRHYRDLVQAVRDDMDQLLATD